MPVYGYRTKSGKRWMFKVSIRNRQYLRRGFLSREEARKEEASFLVSFGKSKRIPHLSEVAESYLETHGSQVKSSTRYRVEGKIRNYVLGRLPDLPLDRYDYALLNRWWTGIKKLDIQRKNEILGFLKAVFDHARVYFGFEGREHDKLLPYRDFSIRERKEEGRKYLTMDEFRELYALEEDPYWKLYLLVSFFTGMRISEVRGLQGKCYDGKSLSVFQQVEGKSGKGRWELTSLKTRSSERSYLLPAFLRHAMDDHFRRFGITKASFVFFGRADRRRGHLAPISENTIVRELRRLSRLSGIRFTSHSFRHGEATLLAQEGLPAEEIGRYLGHSSAEVTKRHYIHETEQRKQEIADLLDRQFGSEFS